MLSKPKNERYVDEKKTEPLKIDSKDSFIVNYLNKIAYFFYLKINLSMFGVTC
ncbi:MAG: hypothetical protein K0S31_1714 [Sphingobacterium multivorum]|jgi:hypothetical protein|nr:hypothetical protein [Sphingobacterium multivorum]